MSSLNRRQVLGSAAALSALPLLFRGQQGVAATRGSNVPAGSPRPFIHTTDLFRPHDDPDDHWDLATGFALARQGLLDLRGILMDNPLNVEKVPELIGSWNKHNHGVHVDRSPDVAAVAQLNYLTDRAVPAATGPVLPHKPGPKVRKEDLPDDLRGVHMLLDLLRRSPQPVAILTAGSCQNVAIAGVTDPRLFARKCAGIYVNAGIGSQDPKAQVAPGLDWLGVEWNVALNKGAYADLFELPCPLYWMPPFNAFDASGEYGLDTQGEYGTVWTFQQQELLPDLSDHLQAYFAYVLNKESGTNWLTYLTDPESKKATRKFLGDRRWMYCTAGFLHAAGKTVTPEGRIADTDTVNSVYEFVPIEVSCSPEGITDWHTTKKTTNRWIFRVKDKDKYPKAMLSALRSTLLALS